MPQPIRVLSRLLSLSSAESTTPMARERSWYFYFLFGYTKLI